MKGIITKLVLIFSGILLGLILAEFISRMFLSKPVKINQFRFSPTFEYEHVPNYSYRYQREEFTTNVFYNADGLRDRQINENKGNNVYRIAVVGDSFVEGAEVELTDTFVKKLEEMLNSSSGNKVHFEVMNFGVIGYNTDHEYVVIKEKIPLYKPDFVVRVFFFNDIDGLNISSLIRVNGDNIETLYPLKEPLQPKIPFIKKVWITIISQSTLWDYLMNKKLYTLTPELLLEFQQFKNKIFIETDSDKEFKNRLQKQINGRKFTIFAAESFLSSKITSKNETWQKEKVVLKKEKELIESQRAKFAVVLATAPMYYRQSSIETFMKTYNLSKDDFNPQLPNKKMSDILEQLNIPYLDLLPIISKTELEKKTLMHYQYDIHWTKEGHQVIAEELYKFLLPKIAKSL